MGIMDFLLGEEEPQRLKDTYRGRNYEGPAHIQSLPFQGHPYMQMPGNSYVPPQPTAMPQPRQGATMSPWNPDTSGIRDESFYQEGGPYYRAGVHRNPHTMQAQPQLSPQLPYNKIDAPLEPRRMPDQHIAGATTGGGQISNQDVAFMEWFQNLSPEEKQMALIQMQRLRGGM